MEEYNIPVFVEAKIEYTKQLVNILKGHFYIGLKSIYEDSVKISNETNTETDVLKLFQNLLSKIPNWNQEIITSETERIINCSKCDWLDDLITAVFISHTKILTSIGPNKNETKVNLKIPKTDNFIHKCYINVAREIWKNPYLFNDKVCAYEYQKNIRDSESIIKNSIEYTVQNLLPIKEILREHLDIYEPPSLDKTDDLGKLLLNELLKNKNNEKEDENENDENNDENNENNDENNDENNENNENDENNDENQNTTLDNTPDDSLEKYTLIEPLATDTIVEPLATDTIVEPLATYTISEPLVTDTIVEPLATDTIVEPLATDTIVEPLAATDTIVGTVATDTIVEPLATDTIYPFDKYTIIEPIDKNATLSDNSKKLNISINEHPSLSDEIGHLQVDKNNDPGVNEFKDLSENKMVYPQPENQSLPDEHNINHNINDNITNKNTTITLDEIDDTQTLDGFLSDTQQLLENKGINIEKTEQKTDKKTFSFFDDLDD